MRTDPAGAARLAPQTVQLHRKLFARLDADRDHRLSLGEIRDSGILRKAGLARTAAEEKDVFNRADTNHDGVLSAGESFELFNGLMQNNPQILALITALVGADEDPAEQPNAAARAAAEADARAETAEDADRRAKDGRDRNPPRAAPLSPEASSAYAPASPPAPPGRFDTTA